MASEKEGWREDYWVEAIESFYEMGIRLVNSSLGYTDGFDKKKENHSKKEVDGKSKYDH